MQAPALFVVYDYSVDPVVGWDAVYRQVRTGGDVAAIQFAVNGTAIGELESAKSAMDNFARGISTRICHVLFVHTVGETLRVTFGKCWTCISDSSRHA